MVFIFSLTLHDNSTRLLFMITSTYPNLGTQVIGFINYKKKNSLHHFGVPILVLEPHYSLAEVPNTYMYDRMGTLNIRINKRIIHIL